jgi:hypothetical protein
MQEWGDEKLRGACTSEGGGWSVSGKKGRGPGRGARRGASAASGTSGGTMQHRNKGGPRLAVGGNPWCMGRPGEEKRNGPGPRRTVFFSIYSKKFKMT